MNASSCTSRTAITGQAASWTIWSISSSAFVVPSWTTTKATSGRSVAVIRATSGSEDSRAMTS
jgi:hypothetical protein